MSARRATASIAAAALLAATVDMSRAAAATEDLRDLAARVASAWHQAGGVVVRRDARFVMEDETTTIDLRGDPPPPERPETTCRRVALIGARGLSFHVSPATGGDDDSGEVASTAGVVELHGCGSVPDRVKLKSDSGRGALETVIASSSTVLPPLSSILLERTGGVLPSAPDPGALPPLPPRAARASAAEARLVAGGFTIAAELTWTASDEGKGGGDVLLEEGCHRFELFASEPRAHEVGRRSRLDLDGAMRTLGGDVLSEDKTIAPDVRLDACVATRTLVTIGFEGAPRGSAVLVAHGSRALPPHLPPLWGPDVRARVASAMLARQVKPPTSEAVLLLRGASGLTPVPVAIEPGACYLVVAAMDRARARGHGIALHVTAGDRLSEDEQGTKDDAAVVSFCAQASSTASLEVDGRSSASGWSLALYRMLGGVWSVER